MVQRSVLRLVSLTQTYSVRDCSLVAQLGRLKSLQVLQGQVEQPVEKDNASDLDYSLIVSGVHTCSS